MNFFVPPTQTVETAPRWWRFGAALFMGLSLSLTWSMVARWLLWPNSYLFEQQLPFMPHGHCYYWRPVVLWPMLVGDLATATAYYGIPAGLILISRWFPPLVKGFAWWFAAFIICCGNTHIASTVTIFKPYYGTQGLVVLLTGAVSLLTMALGLRYHRVIATESSHILDFLVAFAHMSDDVRKKDAQ